MDQRKYLVYLAISLCLNFPLYQASANSPWLPEKGKYNVALSTATIDDESIDRKQQRVESFIEIENRIDVLIQEIMVLEKFDMIVKEVKQWGGITSFTLEKVAVKLKEYGLSQEQIKSLGKEADVKGYNLYDEKSIELLKEKTQKLASRRKEIVKELKENLCNLSAYQQKRISTASVEYAPKDNMSFGIKGDYLENSFTQSKYISAKESSNVKSAEVFYKYKIFQDKNFIFTIQPKFTFNNHSSFNGNQRNQVYHEIGFLTGFTRKITKLEIFTQMSIAIGGGTSKSARSKKYSNFEHMEGVKFPFGISFTKFTKHSFRSNCGPIYEKNIYEQFSVAKRFEFGNLRQKNFTIQLGYYAEHNPKYPMFEVSGSLFSIWSEI